MTEGARHIGDEAAARRLIGSWMRRPVPCEPDPGTGLAVPPAPAEDVIAAARRVAGRADGDEPPQGLRRIAEAMVLDEHPSAAAWSAADRAEALDWIARVIHRHGEDGVERLVGDLNARH